MSPVASVQKQQPLPGRAEIGIVRMNWGDPVHKIAFSQQFYEIIEDEAKTFGATINYNNFSRVIGALKSGKVQAYLMMADSGSSLSFCVGASIQFLSVLTAWNGRDFDHCLATYFEDLCISPQSLMEFMRSTNSRFPREKKLGTDFAKTVIERSIQNTHNDLPQGISSKGFIGEYDPNDKKIVRILDKFGAILGSTENSAVLELNGASNGFKVSVQTKKLVSVDDADNAIDHPNIFVTNWSSKNGEEKLVASFTEALSSFTGKSIVRVQFTSNGRLPDATELKDVVGALISAGHTEIIKRRWMCRDDKDRNFASTDITMRIHILHEPKIVSALTEFGAKPRMLGTRPMSPLIINFSDTPKELIKFCGKCPSLMSA